MGPTSNSNAAQSPADYHASIMKKKLDAIFLLRYLPLRSQDIRAKIYVSPLSRDAPFFPPMIRQGQPTIRKWHITAEQSLVLTSSCPCPVMVPQSVGRRQGEAQRAPNNKGPSRCPSIPSAQNNRTNEAARQEIQDSSRAKENENNETSSPGGLVSSTAQQQPATKRLASPFMSSASEKLYECSACGRCFKRKNDAKRH
ncbi:hypothetical protein VCV18_012696 [Metarhizium anisopliae]